MQKLDSKTIYFNCLSDNSSIKISAYQKLGQYLYQVSCSRLNGSTIHIADDCVQLALTAIWEQIDDPQKGPKRPEQFLSWCTSIVIFKTIDELRKLNRQACTSLESLADTTFQMLFGANSSEVEGDLNRIIVHNESIIECLAALNKHPKLSEKSKTILVEGFLLELTDSELALRLAVSKNNVSVTRTRNRQKLQEDDDLLSILRS